MNLSFPFDPKKLRYTTLLLNGLVIILSGCVFFPLGSVNNFFNSRCALFAKPNVSAYNESSLNLVLDMRKTRWGATAHCLYTTYLPVGVTVIMLVWSWFFLQMKSIYNGGHLFWTVSMNLFLCAVLFIMSFVSSVMISMGHDQFCGALAASVTKRNKNTTITCSMADDFYWAWASKTVRYQTHPINTYLTLAQTCSWFLTLSLLAQCVLYGYIGCKHSQELPQTDNYSRFLIESEEDDTASFYGNKSFQSPSGSIVFSENAFSNSNVKYERMSEPC